MGKAVLNAHKCWLRNILHQNCEPGLCVFYNSSRQFAVSEWSLYIFMKLWILGVLPEVGQNRFVSFVVDGQQWKEDKLLDFDRYHYSGIIFDWSIITTPTVVSIVQVSFKYVCQSVAEESIRCCCSFLLLAYLKHFHCCSSFLLLCKSVQKSEKCPKTEKLLCEDCNI